MMPLHLEHPVALLLSANICPIAAAAAAVAVKEQQQVPFLQKDNLNASNY